MTPGTYHPGRIKPLPKETHLRVRILFVALLATALMAGCANRVPLRQAQIDSIGRDTSPADLNRVLGEATVVAQAEVQDGADRFLARAFHLQTGTRQEMTMVCTPTCIPIFITVPVLADYVVLQTLPAMGLLAWGTPEALSKDADERVSRLMPEVKTRLEAAKAAAK